VPVLAVKNPQGQVQVVDSQGVAYATVSTPPRGVPVINTVGGRPGKDALRAVFVGETALTSGRTAQDNRERYYQNLTALEESTAFKRLAGSVSLRVLVGTAASVLAADAKADFGVFLALRTLSPFAVIGDASLMSTTQPDLYTQWQADQMLTAADRQAGKANFSDAYFADRAAMLSWVLQAQVADTAFDALNLRATAPSTQLSNDPWSFEDRQTGKTVFVSPDGLGSSSIHKIMFGRDLGIDAARHSAANDDGEFAWAA
jgi:hypothetical protein